MTDVQDIPLPIEYPLQSLPAGDTLENLFEPSSDKKNAGSLLMRPSPILIAEYVNKIFYPVSFKGQTYLYDPKTSLYYEDTGTVKQWVQLLIMKAQSEFSQSETMRLPPAQRWESTIRDVNSQVSVMNVVEGKSFPFNTYNGLPCENCVVVFRNNKVDLESYTHEMRFTRKIPVKFNPKADKDKVIKVLQDWMPGTDEDGKEMYEWLLQIPAQAIVQSLPRVAPFKKAYLLIGKPNAGKSSYTNLLQMLFGEKNSSTFMLHEFSDNFIVAELPGRFINCGDDLPFIKIEASNKFKTLTGKRNMMVNPKFGRPYEASITAVQSFSANYPPELASTLIKDEGWWDRWNILLFGNKFEKDPMWEINTFTDEFLEGFLLLVLEEVEKILENGNHLILEQPTETVKGTWTCDLKLFHLFIDSFVDKTSDDEHYISKDDMMRSLVNWSMTCPTEDLQSIEDARQLLPISSQKALTTALGIEGIYPKQLPSGDRSRPYFNVKWKDSALKKSWIIREHSK